MESAPEVKNVWTSDWSQYVTVGPGYQEPHAQLQAPRVRVPHVSAYLRQKVLSPWKAPRLSLRSLVTLGSMAFLANVEPPNVGCNCNAGPHPVLSVTKEL